MAPAVTAGLASVESGVARQEALAFARLYQCVSVPFVQDGTKAASLAKASAKDLGLQSAMEARRAKYAKPRRLKVS